jgi:dihydroorotate dehydrogenase/Pyruvate/2-oxoacid:ferredoxin oxidoreductase delta subunit
MPGAGRSAAAGSDPPSHLNIDEPEGTVSVKETDYLMPLEAAGLKFRNNFVVGSGPTVKTIAMVREIERCGWGAASLKLAIEPTYVSIPPRYRWLKKHKYHAFTAETRLNLDQGLRLMEAARRETRELILYANMAYAGDAGDAGWIDMAKRYEAAGAHVIELNMCCPNMSFNVQSSGAAAVRVSGASVGSDAVLVSAAAEAVARAVRIPVFVKLTPEGGKIGPVARACFDKGIPSVGTAANRLAIPEFDIYQPEKGICRLQEEPTLACFSGPWIKPLALRDVYEMRANSRPQDMVMGSGGVEDWVGAVQMMMCGADFIQICTAVMLKGFGILPGIIKNLRKFMAEQGYAGYADFRGVVVPRITPATDLTITPGHSVIDAEKCQGCGLCEKIGHCYAITTREGKAVVAVEDCTGCGTCADVCPHQAVSLQRAGRPGG